MSYLQGKGFPTVSVLYTLLWISQFFSPVCHLQVYRDLNTASTSEAVLDPHSPTFAPSCRKEFICICRKLEQPWVYVYVDVHIYSIDFAPSSNQNVLELLLGHSPAYWVFLTAFVNTWWFYFPVTGLPGSISYNYNICQSKGRTVGLWFGPIRNCPVQKGVSDSLLGYNSIKDYFFLACNHFIMISLLRKSVLEKYLQHQSPKKFILLSVF